MSLIKPASRASLSPSNEALERSLSAAIARSGAVSTSYFDRVAAAVDASHYLRTPQAVVTPRDSNEIAALLRHASATGQPLTFRSGGTSLSGQATSADVLVDTRRHFRTIDVSADGRTARLGPGATVRQVNARLVRHGRKLGPDPASEIACTIGGVVANNSSGMACGTAFNTYQTLQSAVIVLASGTVIDTGDSESDGKLRTAEPEIWNTLRSLREEVLADPVLAQEITRQFSIKNTMGYGLNSLLDHATPVQILAHLMVGSEGTLGFVAEATFATVPLHPHAATALLVFENLGAATAALVDINATGPATVELMDAASLRAARLDPASRAALPEFEIVDHCALLVEYQDAHAAELADACARAELLFSRLPLARAAVLSQDPATRESLWRVRKGLYATVAGARPSGTTALLEDVAVPVAQLSETCAALTRLFESHGYVGAVIFGHAKDGNLHFLLNEDFSEPANVARYRAFTEDMVDLVLAASGTLKAEHGTGRIMAPFVERQYGPALYRIMRDIKRAFDPAGVLNPDAVMTSDPDLHLRDLKSTPTVEAEVDDCVECGYCEPVCPSKDLTTTPRQRIVVQRAIADAELRGDDALAAELRREQRYNVVETCAVDGMCQTACPVNINTGDLVRRLRSENAGPIERSAWTAAGKAWGPFTSAAAAALTVAAALPAPLVTGPNAVARAAFGPERVPLWSRDVPRGGRKRTAGSSPTSADAVYFQACLGTMFGPTDGGDGVAVAFQSLADKAGVALVQPDAIGGLCCGTPWKSKGLVDGYEDMAMRTTAALWVASDEGRLPIVCDNSSCSEGLVGAVEKAAEAHPAYGAMRIVDAVNFTAEYLLDRLTVTRKLDTMSVHPTCSSTRAGSNANLTRVSAAVSVDATIPDDWGCCGFAGDRGMLHPELTASATSREAREVTAGGCDKAGFDAGGFDAYVSSNRTCEIGMSRATGRPYQHILEVLDRVSSPSTNGVSHV